MYKQENKPKVSIIVPIYNVEKYLRECIDSIVNQTLKEIQIILVDDGSPDGCPAICDEYAAKDNRIKVIHKQNGGYGSAINRGLLEASGEYVGIIESDDYADLRMYELMYNKIIEKEAEVVVCDFFYLDDSENKVMRRYIYDKNVYFDENNCFNIHTSPSIINKKAFPWNKLYKKEFLVKNKIRMKEDRGSYEDQPWNAEVLSKAKIITYTNIPLLFYRLDSNASSTNTGNRSMIKFIKRKAQAREILINNGVFTSYVKEYFYLTIYYGCLYFYKRIEKEFKKEYFYEMKELFKLSRFDKVDFKYFTKKTKIKYKIIMKYSFLFYRIYTKILKLTNKIKLKCLQKKIKRIIKKIILTIGFLFDKCLPKNKTKIIFNSNPDLSDNPYWFYKFIKENKTKYKCYWIVNKKNKSQSYPKNTYKLNSLKALFHIWTSKYVVSNHCNDFVDVIHSNRHIWLNLWHGMPIKTIGYSEKNIPRKILKRYKKIGKKAYQICTSDLFKTIVLSCFNSDYNKCFVTGTPRIDSIFYSENDKIIKEYLNLCNYKKVILFVPTYKEVLRNNTRDVQSKFDNIFYIKDYQHYEFIKYLEENNILFLVKPHPFDETFYKKKFEYQYSLTNNVKIIYNEDISEKNLYIYEIFKFVDLMISDFSSISLDYLILNKPIIYLNNLDKEYNENRGFILEDNYKLFMPGENVLNYTELMDSIKINLSDDVNKQKREKIIPLVHKFIDNKASRRIIEIMENL